MKSVALPLVAALTLTACAENNYAALVAEQEQRSKALGEALERDRLQVQEQSQRISELIKPVVECSRRRAFDLVSSGESAETAARAAVGLCGSEFSNYAAAILHWAAIDSVAERQRTVERRRQQLVEMALTIIVRERQHTQTAPPAPSQPTKKGDSI